MELNNGRVNKNRNKTEKKGKKPYGIRIENHAIKQAILQFYKRTMFARHEPKPKLKYSQRTKNKKKEAKNERMKKEES